MNERERLIELLNRYFTIGDSYAYNLTRVKEAFAIGTVDIDDFVEFDEEITADIADYLLENGVIVPPCKVGDTVWVIRSQTSNGKNLYILEDRVKRIVTERQECLQSAWTRIEFENITSEFEWGFSNIFLTKEEAEKALAEKRTDND